VSHDLGVGIAVAREHDHSTLLDQERRCQRGRDDVTTHTGDHQLVPERHVQRPQGPGGHRKVVAGTGVRHEEIQPRVAAAQMLEERTNGSILGVVQVHRHRSAPALDDLLGRVLYGAGQVTRAVPATVPVGDIDGPARCAQLKGDAATDATGSARDHRNALMRSAVRHVHPTSPHKCVQFSPGTAQGQRLRHADVGFLPDTRSVREAFRCSRRILASPRRCDAP
jgi:hypothetical protein